MEKTYIIACLGIYLTAFTILYNLFKDVRSKLVIHYKFYNSRADHVTTKQLIGFFKKRIVDFDLEKGQGVRTDEKIMPYIIGDLRRCNRITLALNIATLSLFQHKSLEDLSKVVE